MLAPSGNHPAALEISVAAEAGDYAVLDVRAAAGLVLPPHVALHHDGLVHVLAGEVEVVLPAERVTLRAGDHRSLPRRTPRRLQVLTDTHLLVLTMPSGLERLAKLLQPPLPDPDDLAALLAAAGISLLPRGWRAG